MADSTNSDDSPNLASAKANSASPKASIAKANSASRKASPAKANSASPKAFPAKPNSASPAKANSASPTKADLDILAITLGHVFLPSDLDILRIGMLMKKRYLNQWKGLVKDIDMYSNSPDALFANDFPSIKHKNTFLVRTPRAALGNGRKGFDRGVKGPKGGIWEGLEDDVGNIPIVDDQGNIVGYYLLLRFREGGRDGELTDWYMKEFFVSENDEEHVVCTLVKEDKEMNEKLAKFEKACEYFTRKAVAERKKACETTRDDSDVGKPSVKANELLVEGYATRSKKKEWASWTVTRSRSKKTATVSATIKQSASITDVEQPKATHGDIFGEPQIPSLMTIREHRRHDVATRSGTVKKSAKKSTGQANEAISSTSFEVPAVVADTPAPSGLSRKERILKTYDAEHKALEVPDVVAHTPAPSGLSRKERILKTYAAEQKGTKK